MRILLENLLGNAWKYSAGTARRCIEFGVERKDGRCISCATTAPASTCATPPSCSAPSSACTRRQEFEGNGIGLAIVRASCTATAANLGKDAALEQAGLAAASSALKAAEEARMFYAREIVPKAGAKGVQIQHDFKGRDDAIPVPATLIRALADSDKSGNGCGCIPANPSRSARGTKHAWTRSRRRR
jgi:hypothetical protein